MEEEEVAQLTRVDSDVGDLSSTLRGIWPDSPESEIYRVLAIEVAPRIKSHLAVRFELQEADCDDCVWQAFERFRPAVAKRQSVGNPYPYVFQIAVNEARQLLRSRGEEPIDENYDVDHVPDYEVDALDLVDAAGGAEPDGPAASSLIEDAAPELEIEEFWAVEVVRVAVAGLPAGSRRIVELLMYKDLAFEAGSAAEFDYASTDALADLGMREGAFRTAKHRALSKLREAIPATIVAMGLTPPERAEAAIFPAGRWREDDE